MPNYAPTPPIPEHRILLEEIYAKLDAARAEFRVSYPPKPVAAQTPPAPVTKSRAEARPAPLRPTPPVTHTAQTANKPPGRPGRPGRPWLPWTALGLPATAPPQPAEGIKVYALVDPNDDAIRYVGETTADLGVQLTRHTSIPFNKRTRKWFKHLHGTKKKPIIRVILTTDQPGASAEWVKRVQDLGGRLIHLDVQSPAIAPPPRTAKPARGPREDARRVLVRLSDIDRPWLPWTTLAEEAALTPPRGGRTKIYALVDPFDDSIRYIGATTKSLRERLDGHLEKPTNARTKKWIRRLQGANLEPEIRLITTSDSMEAEIYWIAWARRRAALLNIDPGGHYRDDHTGAPIKGIAEEIVKKYYTFPQLQFNKQRQTPRKRKKPPKNKHQNGRRMFSDPKRITSEHLAQVSQRMMQRFLQTNR